MKDDLKYFVGKSCSIAVPAINWRYNVEPMMDYFLGVVEKIDEDGIVLLSKLTNAKSYIFLKHVISIHEEPVLYENNPEHKKIIDEYRDKNPQMAAKTVMPAPAKPCIPVVPPPLPGPANKYVDPKKLAAMSKQAKNLYETR
jgi:hypothetical protein